MNMDADILQKAAVGKQFSLPAAVASRNGQVLMTSGRDASTNTNLALHNSRTNRCLKCIFRKFPAHK